MLDDEGKPRTEEIELWKRDPVACIRELMGDARFKEHMCYTPEQVYTDDTGTSRVYSEMGTADWWWQIQVHLLIFVLKGILTMTGQKLLPKGVTIALVIIASDKTQLSPLQW